MAKITINDVNYYTDDFNEEQAKAYGELQVASAELERLTYLARVLDNRVQILAGLIESLADQPEANAEEKGEDE